MHCLSRSSESPGTRDTAWRLNVLQPTFHFSACRAHALSPILSPCLHTSSKMQTPQARDGELPSLSKSLLKMCLESILCEIAHPKWPLSTGQSWISKALVHYIFECTKSTAHLRKPAFTWTCKPRSYTMKSMDSYGKCSLNCLVSTHLQLSDYSSEHRQLKPD